MVGILVSFWNPCRFSGAKRSISRGSPISSGITNCLVDRTRKEQDWGQRYPLQRGNCCELKLQLVKLPLFQSFKLDWSWRKYHLYITYTSLTWIGIELILEVGNLIRIKTYHGFIGIFTITTVLLWLTQHFGAFQHVHVGRQRGV